MPLWMEIVLFKAVAYAFYPHVYISKKFKKLSKKRQKMSLKHEKVHLQQQKKVGRIKLAFLYLFVLPILWNPWRYKWEYEAYMKAGFSKKETEKRLRSSLYGWLIFHKY